MKIRSNTDNRYPVGSLVTARNNADTQLIIEAYRQRIYYCQVIGFPLIKSIWFEREIELSSQVILFFPVTRHGHYLLS